LPISAKWPTIPRGEGPHLWLDQKDALLAGRRPKAVTADGLTVARLCNDFQNHKAALRDAGEIGGRIVAEYRACIERLAKAFGRDRPVDDLVADDFATLRQNIAKQWGPVRLGNEIQRVRSIFKFGYDAGLLDKPPRFGPDSRSPPQRSYGRTEPRGGCICSNGRSFWPCWTWPAPTARQ